MQKYSTTFLLAKGMKAAMQGRTDLCLGAKEASHLQFSS